MVTEKPEHTGTFTTDAPGEADRLVTGSQPQASGLTTGLQKLLRPSE